MATWKRDFARGLIVLAPVLVTGFVLYLLYGFIESLTPGFLVPDWLLEGVIADEMAREQATAFLRVVVSMGILAVILYGCGSMMRTTVGPVAERMFDSGANSIPGVRVVYNASKTAAETAVGDQDQLQEPVKLEVWDEIRMTAFKTGQPAPDDRELYFIPTSPNITTGFLVEVDPDEVTSLDETSEEALTRVLSAGFGDADTDRGMSGVPIDVVSASSSRSDDT
ncbi:DUF502 domain-containing protein [Natronolimnobius sp. AArcel1]|uniref:DUF502 domain-containing protein n=1 Tax=Natronolimnobius sp. AArcel1 TaxID=1679093 RepID=UPI0013ED60AB|nr:DUF502 domain-containing protein [Natronolimnobius sp. AArcel1]NGM67980.1 DUF502 domain-containing protein [Natronolimnobius sp. AArcel1]